MNSSGRAQTSCGVGWDEYLTGVTLLTQADSVNVERSLSRGCSGACDGCGRTPGVGLDCGLLGMIT